MASESELRRWQAVALEAARAAAGAVRASRDPHAYTGTINDGGDRVLAVDIAADRAIRETLARALAPDSYATFSEESGLLGDADRYPLLVIDPVDGSAQARRRHPDCAVSIAVAAGPSMGDIVAGVVQPMAGGDAFHAIRGQGAFLGDQPLPRTVPPDDVLRSVLLEGTDATAAASMALRFARHDPECQLQVSGSIALQLSLLAAGCYDALLACRPGAGAYDIAAAWLIAREAGIAYADARGLDTARAPLVSTTVQHQPAAARRADHLEAVIARARDVP
jgi:myo-inositol-1(or 4)-monophosphatase